MGGNSFNYVIVGGGLAGASAIEGIREHDPSGTILLVNKEPYPPYHRPPLSKGLWTGKKKVEDIGVHDKAFYRHHGVEIKLSTEIVSIDVKAKSISNSSGTTYRFDKLLLSTGGVPAKLKLDNSAMEGIVYFRTLGDYLNLFPQCNGNASVLVVGGGFIGTELAAAFVMSHLQTTLIFPGPWPCHRIFPAYLGMHILKLYREHGINVITEDQPAKFEKNAGKWLMQSKRGKKSESDMVVAGIGISPSIELALQAGLKTENGIVVNTFLQTSHPDIYAAGDNANYPDKWIGSNIRTEHWDNSLNQGKLAGKNMAGAHEPYEYMPYFFSDLFDFGFEAVGNIDSKLETFADWKEENVQGTIYYLQGNKIKGIMLCNIWGKLDLARSLIEKAEPIDSIATLKNKISN
jgi:3-phenylpropionate/trans-cinnamate dioxygenase ferredoxin reductase component